MCAFGLAVYTAPTTGCRDRHSSRHNFGAAPSRGFLALGQNTHAAKMRGRGRGGGGMETPFVAGIDDLGTFPDRAKIDALGMIARDALGNQNQVRKLCNILLNKLQTADAPRKLPILYLLDYLSKKLGAEFQNGFVTLLVPTVVAAYSAVSCRCFLDNSTGRVQGTGGRNRAHMNIYTVH